MRATPAPFGFFLAAIALLVSHPADGAERFRVCSITINSDDEIRTFRKHLPGSDFEFVELTELESSPPPSGEPGWFAAACAGAIRCDVLVVSGHFSDTYAGSFGTTFAGKSGLSLALETLESRSCDRSCAGVVSDPLEVFLFGCRTLAAGLESRALPRGDRDLLAEHGVEPAAADGILEEIRYHGEETSNRRRMRFAFAGVPHVFGFTWSAPTGAPLTPDLDRYFRRVGDYAKHLREIARRRAAGESPAPNRHLARSLRAGTFDEDRGFTPRDPELRHAASSCFLRSGRNGTAARLERIESLIESGGFLVQLAAIADFFASVDPASFGAAEAAALDRIRGHEPTRRATLALANGLESPILRLEVVRVARGVGWMSDEEALHAQREIVRRLLVPPAYGEGRDVVCGMDPAVRARIDLRAEDLSPKLYEDEFGIEALGCLGPRDPRIHARLAQALSHPKPWIARAAAAALMAIRPAEIEVQLELARQLRRSDLALRASAQAALREIRPTDPRVVTAIREADPSFSIDWQ